MKRWKRKPAPDVTNEDGWIPQGLDSEFFLIEKKLANLGLGRRAEEPLYPWVERIRPNLPVDYEELRILIALHYRLRFDPRGLEVAERAELRRRAMALLEKPNK
jgi:hypothetical protein